MSKSYKQNTDDNALNKRKQEGKRNKHHNHTRHIKRQAIAE